jgi:DNA-binding beta-propeller fold protein YncE
MRFSRVCASIAVAAALVAAAASPALGAPPCSTHHRHHCRKPKPALPAGAKVVATIPLGVEVNPIGNGIAADEAAVWVLGPTDLIRIDPATNAVVARIPMPLTGDYLNSGLPRPISGPGGLWQPDPQHGTIMRIDPATNTVAATIPLGSDATPAQVGFAGGAAWAPEFFRAAVVRIDPTRNAVTATIPVGPADSDPAALVAGPSGVWVDLLGENDVVHIDPTTNVVVGTVPVRPAGQRDVDLILDGDTLWIEGTTGVDRVDTATGRIVAHVATPFPTGRGAAGLGALWVPTKAGLVRIDEASNRIVGLLKRIPTGDLAIADGSIWSAGASTSAVWRLVPAG